MDKAAWKPKIRKGDTVMVISGRERGKMGKVLSVDAVGRKLVVEKLNIIKRHTKPNPKAKQGGILEREGPIPYANVMYYNSNIQKPVRVGIRRLEDGRRLRFCRSSNDTLE